MPDPDILWQDMAKLNSLYEELCWDADDDLVFTIEGDRIIIRNVLKKTRHDFSTFKSTFVISSIGSRDLVEFFVS